MDPRVKPAGDAKERAIACCELICVDPAQAHEFWPHVASLIKAAAVTELTSANGEKFCTIVACGGHDRSQWLPLIARLEAYGRREGCAAMRIYGRRGWRKLLPEYRTTRVLLEKELVTHRHPRA